MARYKVEFDRELCIGALACNAVAPELWPRAEDGKVDLTGATYNEETKKWELIIEEKDLEINKESAEVCPVEAIIVTKLDDEKQQNNQNIDNKENNNKEKLIQNIDNKNQNK